MATTRRVFLEVMGTGVAMSAIDVGCGSRLVDEEIFSVDTVDGGEQAQAVGAGGGSAGGAGALNPGPSGVGGASSIPPAGSGGDSPGTGGAPVLDATAPLPAGQIPAGNVSDLPQGSIVRLAGANVAIARDANGIYALSLVCTHQGCTINSVGMGATAGFSCPCHGSQFDGNGAVLRGPAARPLPHYAVAVDAAGNIVVDVTMRVAATTRVAV